MSSELAWGWPFWGGPGTWTGVIISESGEILTHSHALRGAPVVNMELWDGTQAQACVTGRDDDTGTALLKPLVEPARSYDYLAVAGDGAAFGERLTLLQHKPYEHLDERGTQVIGHVASGTGYPYFRIDVPDDSAADGAVLLNGSGEVQGIRMPRDLLRFREIGNAGEVYAADAPQIADIALPLLRSGRIHVESWHHRHHGARESVVTPIPLIFHGAITVDGAPAPTDSTVYARVSKEGQLDDWIGERISEAGRYVLSVSVPSNYYVGATVEFWLDCRRFSTTAVFEHAPGSVVELDLSF
ncbi:MAG: serine protease [Chloroflexota bacterium]|nr:serine protease [Chloroflexota bacterium]